MINYFETLFQAIVASVPYYLVAMGLLYFYHRLKLLIIKKPAVVYRKINEEPVKHIIISYLGMFLAMFLFEMQC